MKPAVYGRLAALLFAAQAVFPIVHRAVGGDYWGFTHAHNVVIDAGLAFIWSVSAIAGLIQRPPNAFFVMLGGCAVTFAHFLMFSVSSSAHGPYGAGLPWLAVLPVQGYLTVRAAPAFFSSERSPAAKEKEREEPSLAHWWSLSRLRHR